jgi:hypothetical protein
MAFLSGASTARTSLEESKAASVGGLFRFGSSGPNSRGWELIWGRPFQPPATWKEAANGQANYRNSADRSELGWSTSVGGLSHFPFAPSLHTRTKAAELRLLHLNSLVENIEHAMLGRQCGGSHDKVG